MFYSIKSFLIVYEAKVQFFPLRCLFLFITFSAFMSIILSVLGPLLFCLYTTPLTYLFQTPLFRITFTLTIFNSISLSLLLILFLIFPSFLRRLILSLIGLLPIVSLSISLNL